MRSPIFCSQYPTEVRYSSQYPTEVRYSSLEHRYQQLESQPVPEHSNMCLVCTLYFVVVVFCAGAFLIAKYIYKVTGGELIIVGIICAVLALTLLECVRGSIKYRVTYKERNQVIL